MSASLNTCCFSGYVTRNAEASYTSGGQYVCKFSLAVNGYKKDAPAMFVNCSLWGKTAETLNGYITKGTYLVVSGAINYRTYTKNDGTMGSSLDLNVTNVVFGPKAETSDNKTQDAGDDPFAD